MRQAKTLPPPLVVPPSVGLCRLSHVSAGHWLFPALSQRIFPRMLGPLPRRSLWCIRPFLPRGHRPSPCRERLGTPHDPYSDFRTGDMTGLQSFADVQASGFARHPGRSYRRGPFDPRGSRGLYVRAYDGLLPPRPSDMLTVRIGQLTAWGLPPHQIRGLAGRSPDIISAISMEVRGPIPRRVRQVHLPIPSPTTAASRHGKHVRHTG